MSLQMAAARARLRRMPSIAGQRYLAMVIAGPVCTTVDTLIWNS
jgi:hypothetical protein